MRPLEDILSDDISYIGWAPERLTALPSTAGFQATHDYFMDYPPLSLSSPSCRAYMYSLIRADRPRLFVEIGTYHGGMTEVAARALWANGVDAQIITIDPYGGDRVPGILENWPKELSDLVSYLPLSSMEFYIQLRRISPIIDICFIDGDHSYEFAFFDLNCISQWMRPGGVIIMDDYNQPGVFWAAKNFLELNRGWREIGGVFDQFDTNAPFESIRPSIPNTAFLILSAPDAIEVTGKPKVFEYNNYTSHDVSGVNFSLLSDHDGGKIEVKTFFRSFFYDNKHGNPQQLQFTGSTKIPVGVTDVSLIFDDVLYTDLDPSISYRNIEVNIIWVPHKNGQTLKLSIPPQPLSAS